MLLINIINVRKEMNKTKLIDDNYCGDVAPYGFLKGFRQLPQNKVNEFKQEFAKIIGVEKLTYPTFYYRLKGRIEPKASEYFAITRLFNSYGITEIWGA